MERVYVLEQALTCAAEKFQLKFADESVPLLAPVAGVQPVPTNKGLVLLSINESTLDSAIALLHTRYGDSLLAADRRVRYRNHPAMAPVMDVFLRVPGEHADKASRDLVRRRAAVRFQIIEKRGWLIRAEAPMAELLGYGTDLSKMTEDRAEHWITFNRWEPAETDDGGRAA